MIQELLFWRFGGEPSMIDNPSSAIAEIKRLGLPNVFVAVMNGTFSSDQTISSFLRWKLRRPRYYFEGYHELVRILPVLENLIPLWEEAGPAIVGKLSDGGFIRLYYEDLGLEPADRAINVMGRSYQQFVTSILLEFAEAGLFDEYAQELEQILEYKHLEPLVELLRDYADDDGELNLDRFRDSL